MKPYFLFLISAFSMILSCSKVPSSEDSTSFVTQKYLDSISCPQYVIAPIVSSAKSFHFYMDCSHIKKKLSNYKFIHRDSIPSSFSVCKSCLSIVEKSSDVLNNTSESFISNRVNSQKENHNPAVKSKSSKRPAMKKRDPMNEFVE